MDDTVKAKLERLDKIQRLLWEMFEAEASYGAGFYGEDTWLTPYNELAEIIGYFEDD